MDDDKLIFQAIDWCGKDNENEDGTFRQFELYENISQFIETYENARKEKKAKKLNLEKFVDDEETK